jgi:transposase
VRVASLRSLIGAYDQAITALQRELAAVSAGDVGYLAIQTIPGVGPVLAAVFVAEIGKGHRFAAAPQLCSWAGLTPRHRESDTTVRRGPITKQGPRLVRWAAVEPPSGCLEPASRPPRSTASPTGAAPASAGSRPPASC